MKKKGGPSFDWFLKRKLPLLLTNLKNNSKLCKFNLSRSVIEISRRIEFEYLFFSSPPFTRERKRVP